MPKTKYVRKNHQRGGTIKRQGLKKNQTGGFWWLAKMLIKDQAKRKQKGGMISLFGTPRAHLQAVDKVERGINKFGNFITKDKGAIGTAFRFLENRLKQNGGQRKRQNKQKRLKQQGGILPLAAAIPALIAAGKVAGLGALSAGAGFGVDALLNKIT